MKTKRFGEHFRRVTASVFTALIAYSVYIFREIWRAAQDTAYPRDICENFPTLAEGILGAIVIYLAVSAVLVFYVCGKRKK